MKILPLLAAILFSAVMTNAQPTTLEWVKNQGGRYGIPYSNDIATDASGNTYTTGSFSRTVDFDPGPGITELSAQDVQSTMFLVKYDYTGNIVWAFNIGGTALNKFAEPQSITVDALGNILVIGTFYGIIDFDPGPGI